MNYLDYHRKTTANSKSVDNTTDMRLEESLGEDVEANEIREARARYRSEDNQASLFSGQRIC
jgi:hypothetical protein